MIDIAGLDKAEVLCALYNASRQQGMGFLHPDGAKSMNVEQAREVILKGDDHAEMMKAIGANRGELYFDYLHGRVMKVDIAGDELDGRLFDRDNGEGAAARTVAALRARLAN